jgi:hypothetical protein
VVHSLDTCHNVNSAQINLEIIILSRMPNQIVSIFNKFFYPPVYARTFIISVFYAFFTSFFFCTPFPLFQTINPLKENLLRITECESDNWDEKQYFSSNEEEIQVEELGSKSCSLPSFR